MKTGFRDRHHTGAHQVRLDGIDLRFGDDGVLWEPKPHERQVLTRDHLRMMRFERVEQADKPSPGRRGGRKDDGAAAVVADGAPASTSEPSDD